jgi:hypothetical protein
MTRSDTEIAAAIREAAKSLQDATGMSAEEVDEHLSGVSRFFPSASRPAREMEVNDDASSVNSMERGYRASGMNP